MRSQSRDVTMGDIDGNNLVYHYIKKQIIPQNDAFSHSFIKKILEDLSIWLPVELYEKVPILYPFVIRDLTCRKSANKKEEEWGSPNEKGFFRDDNTIIKEFINKRVNKTPFKIAAPNFSYLHNGILKKGFTACHIWPKVHLGGEEIFSTRQHMINSFVPNLVWLPSQFGKLTDHDPFAKHYAQFLSTLIYHNHAVPENKRDLVKNIWDVLPGHTDEFNVEDINLGNLNFFKLPRGLIEKHCSNLEVARELIKNPDLSQKLLCSRYLKGLNRMNTDSLRGIREWMDEYIEMIS